MRRKTTPDRSPRPPLDSERERVVDWIREAHDRRLPLNIGAVRRRAPEILDAAFSVRPFWGWRRAVEAAGLRYARLAVELEETVRCRLCGLERVSLTAHLCRQHELVAGEYQETFPEAPIHSEAMRGARGLSAKGPFAHWEPVWSREYVLDRVSEYHEMGVPVNRKSLTRVDPALVGMAMLRIGPWDDVLRGAGLNPRTVRLNEAPRRLSRDQLFGELRALAASGRAMNAASIYRGQPAIWTAARKQFGTYRRALLETIRSACRRVPSHEVVTGTDMLRYTKLAWLSRHHFGSWDAGLRRAGMSGTERLDVVRYADLHTLESDLKLLLAGRLRANAERRRALFRYAERLRGSVIGALEEAGASRSRALSIAASPWPAYPSGDAVLVALETRRRAGLDVDFRHVKSGRHGDPDLAKAARCLFGSWEAAVAATASPSRNERPRASRRS